MAGGGVERIGAVFRGTIAKPWRIPRKQGQLGCFLDQPVAEIVQCGEPPPNFDATRQQASNCEFYQAWIVVPAGLVRCVGPARRLTARPRQSTNLTGVKLRPT